MSLDKKDSKALIAAMGAGVLLLVLRGPALMLAGGGISSQSTYAGIIRACLIMTAVISGAPILLYIILFRSELRAFFSPHENKKSTAQKAALTVGSVIIGAAVCTGLEMLFSAAGTGTDIPLPSTLMQLAGYIAVFALLPAVSEELLFRGLMLPSLQSSGRLSALVFSSLFFAVFHFNGVMMLYAFLCGMVIGTARLVTGRLYPCIIIHFIVNSAAVLIPFLTGG